MTLHILDEEEVDGTRIWENPRAGQRIEILRLTETDGESS